MEKLIPRCHKCGSNDVVRDASAAWNEETQAWEFKGLQDNVSCNACGSEDIAWPPKPKPSEAVDFLLPWTEDFNIGSRDELYAHIEDAQDMRVATVYLGDDGRASAVLRLLKLAPLLLLDAEAVTEYCDSSVGQTLHNEMVARIAKLRERVKEIKDGRS